MIAPLATFRVLDLATGAAAVVGRDFAWLGAQVTRVEPPGGHADRHALPRADGLSLDFAIRNAGKANIELDLVSEAARFEALLADADLLIESTAPGSPESLRLDAAGIAQRHPTLVVLSISDFGQTGPFARWQATAPVLDALTGELSRSGLPGRPPLLLPGALAIECALVQAGFAALLALVNRLKTGAGDHIDYALALGAGQALDPGYGIRGSAAAGSKAGTESRDRPDARFMYPIIPCADGLVRICLLAARQWQGMFKWLGSPAEFADPSFNNLGVRYRTPTLIPAITAFFADKTRAELEAQGQAHGVPIAGLRDPVEALSSEQAIARRAFAPAAITAKVSAPMPDGIVEIDGVRAGVRPAGSLTALPAWPWQGPRPLSGLRVLDLGIIVVGAEQSRLLADQGADVIKVEAKAFPDGMRQTADGGPMSESFAVGHRNKRGLGLNLRAAEGKALFLKLVAQSDVVMTNFKPGTLESLGLGYADLVKANPAIILTDSSAFGASGPWAGRLGYGPLVRAASGLTAQWNYPGAADDPDSYADAVTIYPDHVAGRVMATATLALLIRRLTTDRGGTISSSQAEVMLAHQATAIAAHALQTAGTPLETEPAQDAPWGVFPAAGDDEWCAVTIRHGDDWAALCRVIGRADLASDAALATRTGRDANRARIDAALTVWLTTRTPDAAMQLLQAAGVPAAAMLRVSELPDSPLYQHGSYLAHTRHPALEAPFWQNLGPARFTRIAEPPLSPAPVVGQHSRAIARDVLGLTEAEISALIETGTLEVPTDAVAALVSS